MRTLSWIAILACLIAGLVAPGRAAADEGQPPAAPDVQLTALRYEPTKNAYTAYLSVSSSEHMAQLSILVEDQETGLAVFEQAKRKLGPTVHVTLAGSDLESGHKYVLLVRAIGENGIYLRRAGADADRGDATVLTSKAFVHHPPQPAPVTLKVDWVNADYTDGKLVMKLDILNERPGLSYQVIVTDDNGARVLEVSHVSLTSPRIEMPLPTALANAVGEGKYRVTVRVSDGQEQRVAEAVYEEFKTAPPSRGLLTRLQSGLAAQPSIPTAMAAVVVTTLLLLTWMTWGGHRMPKLTRPTAGD